VIDGWVTRIDPETKVNTPGVACWILLPNDNDSVQVDEIVQGRLIGSFASGADIRPLFVVFGGSGGRILWGVVQSIVDGNGTGQISRLVSIKACASPAPAAPSVYGDAFTVYTPSLGAVTKCNKDTALFPGYVVGYQNEPPEAGAGMKIIVTDCWDVPIGNIELTTEPWGVGPRDGWINAESAEGRFLLGASPAEDDAPVGIEVGPGSGPDWIAEALYHGWGHAPCGRHPLALNAYNGAGIQIFPFQGLTLEAAEESAGHLEVNTVPPYITYRVLKRTS
jgi:hypothetical protein